MKGEDINIYSKNGSLIIESTLVKVREIIMYRDIDDIIIKRVNEVYDNQMDVYLSNPIRYENSGKNFIHSIVFQIFLFFHRNKKIINMSYSNNDLLLILNEMKNNIPLKEIPDSLDKSLFWKEVSDNFSFPMVKLIFSRNNLSLFEVLNKYKNYNEK